jgi:hypothetical protein
LLHPVTFKLEIILAIFHSTLKNTRKCSVSKPQHHPEIKEGESQQQNNNDRIDLHVNHCSALDLWSIENSHCLTRQMPGNASQFALNDHVPLFFL